MKRKHFDQRRGYAVMEYIILVVIIVLALVTMGDYIKRGLAGRMESAGQTFSYGRQETVH